MYTMFFFRSYCEVRQSYMDGLIVNWPYLFGLFCLRLYKVRSNIPDNAPPFHFSAHLLSPFNFGVKLCALLSYYNIKKDWLCYRDRSF